MKATFTLMLLAVLALGATGCCGSHPLRDRWSNRGQQPMHHDNCQVQNPCCAPEAVYGP